MRPGDPPMDAVAPSDAPFASHHTPSWLGKPARPAPGSEADGHSPGPTPPTASPAASNRKDMPTPGKDMPTPGKDMPTPGKDTPTPGKDMPTPGEDGPAASPASTPGHASPGVRMRASALMPPPDTPQTCASPGSRTCSFATVDEEMLLMSSPALAGPTALGCQITADVGAQTAPPPQRSVATQTSQLSEALDWTPEGAALQAGLAAQGTAVRLVQQTVQTLQRATSASLSGSMRSMTVPGSPTRARDAEPPPDFLESNTLRRRLAEIHRQSEASYDLWRRMATQHTLSGLPGYSYRCVGSLLKTSSARSDASRLPTAASEAKDQTRPRPDSAPPRAEGSGRKPPSPAGRGRALAVPSDALVRAVYRRTRGDERRRWVPAGVRRKQRVVVRELMEVVQALQHENAALRAKLVPPMPGEPPPAPQITSLMQLDTGAAAMPVSSKPPRPLSLAEGSDSGSAPGPGTHPCDTGTPSAAAGAVPSVQVHVDPDAGPAVDISSADVPIDTSTNSGLSGNSTAAGKPGSRSAPRGDSKRKRTKASGSQPHPNPSPGPYTGHKDLSHSPKPTTDRDVQQSTDAQRHRSPSPRPSPSPNTKLAPDSSRHLTTTPLPSPSPSPSSTATEPIKTDRRPTQAPPTPSSSLAEALRTYQPSNPRLKVPKRHAKRSDAGAIPSAQDVATSGVDQAVKQPKPRAKRIKPSVETMHKFYTRYLPKSQSTLASRFSEEFHV